MIEGTTIDLHENKSASLVALYLVLLKYNSPNQLVGDFFMPNN